MLELTKKTLVNVSFDASLFQKELYKALRWLTDKEDLKRFRAWCVVEFGQKYPSILPKAFERLRF
jgi:hypothetical protein